MGRLCFSIILISVCTFQAIGQRYNFENYSVDQGLAQSEIYAVCEDSRGVLWIGTHGGGIVKYDGFSFNTLREENGLVNNYVLSIFEDKNGILWIGTEKGLCTFDGKKFSSVNLIKEKTQPSISEIIQDKSNNYWIATDKGLFKYTRDTVILYSTLNGLPDNSIHCLFEDLDKIWVGTNKGAVYILNDSVNTISQSEIISSGIIRGICTDKKGNLWFATYNTGVSCLSADSIRHFQINGGLNNNKIFCSFCDKKGNIWFGTNNGAILYNGATFKAYNEASGLANNVVLSITQDSFDDIWFGTSGGGLSRFDNERFVHYSENEYMGRMIYTLLEALNGNMIFGTSKGGLTVFDGKEYSLLKEDMRFTSSMVKALHYSKDSALWIGTLDDGCFRFDKKGFKKYTTLHGLKSNNITSFASDKYGNLWVSSIDSGISVMPIGLDTFLFVYIQQGLGSNTVYTLAADTNGIIWAGTDNGGLNKITLIKKKESYSFSVDRITMNEGLTSNSIRSVVIDSAMNIFLGTAGGGINIFSGKTIIPITENQGLSSNNIYSLIFDRDYNLWAGTEQGIDKLTFNKDFTIKNIHHYGRNEGFRGIELNRNSSCIDKEGNIWFGTVNGVTSYNPKADINVAVAPKIHITGIKLFFNKIENTPFADSITPWYPLPQKLILPYKENTLTFEFLGIYLRNPLSVRYRWILEGFDKEWSPALDQREVTYTHLPPGKYTFKVISCDENNHWNETPAVYQFEILSPLWQKIWFRILSVVLILVTISGIIYFWFRQVKIKNKAEHDRLKMERNIIELEQEAARLQMNPHFIFNSLNSIQGFIATEDTFQAKKYLAKFARLMRLILENAREEYIPLTNEIDILENYLELEKLSSNNKFDFAIHNNNSIDTETVEIPPMMIQPFVENAIIHGIKKKEGKGKIDIFFKVNGQILQCEIIDNGIGRIKSAENKAKIVSKHKSTGITVTTKRLEQLKIQTGLDGGIETIDLYENDFPSGTKVIVSIPFETY